MMSTWQSNGQMCSIVAVFVVISLLVLSDGAELMNCRKALGMQSGAIPDSAINASSSYDYISVGPSLGRIRSERGGGAWCPKEKIGRDVYEYLEISFPELKMITLIETQGRFGNGQGVEYVEGYLVEYQRLDGGAWRRYRNHIGEEQFQGNTNTYTEVTREVNPPIIASRIRIIPSSSHLRTVCMRVELYGCSWRSGLLSYSMRKGDRRGNIDHNDKTYDGRIQDNYMSGGLGQLVDGIEGPHRLDQQSLGRKGYEWVGWQNRSATRPPVEILFEFDRVRNFTEVRFHMNNNFARDIRVFRAVRLYFSVGGKYYQERPVVYEYMRDTVMETARVIIVPISHRIGRFMRADFYFDAKWLLISEVYFESELALGGYSFEAGPPTDSLSSTSLLPAVPPLADYDESDTVMEGDIDFTEVSSVNGIDRRHEQPIGLFHDHLIGVAAGLIAIVMLMLFVVVLIVMRSRRRRKCDSKGHLVDSQQVTLNLNDLRVLTSSSTSKLSNGNLYNSLQMGDEDTLYLTDRPYREPFDVLIGRKLPDLPVTPTSTLTRASQGDYAVPEMSLTLGMGQPTATYHDSKRGLGMVASLHSRSVGTIHPAMPLTAGGVNSLWADGISLLEFPRESLHFVEKLGEGQFGEVHLCEASNMGDFLGDDFLINRTDSASMLVAVKIMRTDADSKARNDFEKEMRMLSRLRDPNIVRILGMCVEGGPLSVVVEYMRYGDLHQFLQLHIPQDSAAGAQRTADALSNGCLIYMAMQVASGMKYLEALNLVHRDLATRNCLVGSQYTIKISDFGMSRSLYSSDYYRIEGKLMLPIRWMAWESIVLGKFSTKSDVWSFGVTLWEMMTFARVVPYDLLSDEQVIENCGHFYDNIEHALYLPMTTGCSKEIYDLMMTCWNRDDTQRPTFREIHMFLQRKNLGYKPQEDWLLSGLELSCAQEDED